MHEDRILADLRSELDRLAGAARPSQVASVEVWLGALSHMKREVLLDRWASLTAGTQAEGATLHVTVSDDLTDPRAQGVVLRSVVVRSPDGSAPGGRPGPAAPEGS
jgi:hypothetical protein